MKTHPIINKESCKGCGRCVYHCRNNCFAFSEDVNQMGYHYPVYIGEGCNGCSDCWYTCSEPLAIEVHKYIKRNKVEKAIKAKIKRCK